jgi:hypothetical protein
MTNFELITNQVKAELDKISSEAQSFIYENHTKTFYFETTINDSNIDVYVNIFEEFEYLRIALHLPLIVPMDKRVEVANYFFEQNEYLSYGSFLFSIETGRVILKSDIQFQNINLSLNDDYFATILADCFDLMNNTYPALMQLIYTSLDSKFLINRFVNKQKVFYN